MGFGGLSALLGVGKVTAEELEAATQRQMLADRT